MSTFLKKNVLASSAAVSTTALFAVAVSAAAVSSVTVSTASVSAGITYCHIPGRLIQVMDFIYPLCEFVNT